MNQRLANEIEHGRYLAEHGAGEVWNWEGVAGQRRWARRVEMLTARQAQGMEVLELGCGTGLFTRELAKTGANVTAIDISPELLQVAREHVQAANVRFLRENAYGTSFPAARFDSVVGSSVLHHLDPEQALGEMYRLLKPGGSFTFTEPNMLNPQIAVQKNIPPIKRWLGDSPDETAFFKWGIAARLRRHGYAEIRVRPFDFLHPAIPGRLVPMLEGVCLFMEKVPLLSEIAGSLYIQARKPA